MHMAFYPSSQSEFKYRFYGSLEREPCYFLGTCSSQNCYFFLLKAAVVVLVSANIMEKVAGFRKGNLVTTVLNFWIPIYKSPSSLAHFLVFRLHTRCGCCQTSRNWSRRGPCAVQTALKLSQYDALREGLNPLPSQQSSMEFLL